MNKVAIPPLPIHDVRLRKVAFNNFSKPKRVGLRDAAREPFRLFFPLAVVAGIVGVSLWPLYFTHVISAYPSVSHARIMASGFFGAFILGFLGTAMPRMLSAHPFRIAEVLPLLVLEGASVVAFATGQIFWGDVLWGGVLLFFCGCLISRAKARKDLPPPGFVLVGLSLVCVITGAALAIWLSLAERAGDVDPRWVIFQRLVSYQGFVLLPILGIGPFLLPRFFGLPTPEFPEARIPDARWLRKAAFAFGIGLIVVGSFAVESWAWERTAYAIRFGATLFYFICEMPLRRAPGSNNPVGLSIRISLFAIVAGFLTIVLVPGYRVALLHLTLIGGFAVLTLAVATRVVFGHSGNIRLLKGRNRWLLVAVGLMLIGMLSRISGDFVPKVISSHYSYGALFWIAGVVTWAAYVLPKVRLADEE